MNSTEQNNIETNKNKASGRKASQISVWIKKYRIELLLKTAGLFLVTAFVLSQFFEATIDIKPRFKLTENKGAEGSAGGLIEADGVDDKTLEEIVLPQEGVILPLNWGNIGKQLVETGVIDSVKFEKIYASRGGLDEYSKQILYGDSNGDIRMDSENSGFLLNLLWAFGLANSNVILDEGPMQSPKYGGAGRFASTGGWTISQGSAMNHYSKHSFITLTQAQQELVERV